VRDALTLTLARAAGVGQTDDVDLNYFEDSNPCGSSDGEILNEVREAVKETVNARRRVE
jgi:hypothetical protein